MKSPADGELELDALFDGGDGSGDTSAATHVDAGELETEVRTPEGWTPAQFWGYAEELQGRITGDLNAIVALSETAAPELDQIVNQTPQERLALIHVRAQQLLEWLST